MSNLEQTQATIEKGIRYLVLDPGVSQFEKMPERIAEALADSALLAPDLTEPTATPRGELTWAAGTVYFDETEQSIGIELPGRLRGLSTYAAREIGRGLLAAADHQEKSANNG